MCVRAAAIPRCGGFTSGQIGGIVAGLGSQGVVHLYRHHDALRGTWSSAVPVATVPMHHVFLAITFLGVTGLVFGSLIALERMIGG